MSDSPDPGPVHQPGTPTLEHAPDHRNREEQQELVANRLPPQQRAPSGVDVKDLRPLRGRPFGPIPDPDASPRRAREQEEDDQNENQEQERGLTGPAPSGMSCRNCLGRRPRIRRNLWPLRSALLSWPLRPLRSADTVLDRGWLYGPDSVFASNHWPARQTFLPWREHR
jgi:hypothetical protein